jgi:L-rhamnose isomerase
MPWQAVWEHYCFSRSVSPGIEWLTRVRAYEKDVLNKRASAQLTPQ